MWVPSISAWVCVSRCWYLWSQTAISHVRWRGLVRQRVDSQMDEWEKQRLKVDLSNTTLGGGTGRGGRDRGEDECMSPKGENRSSKQVTAVFMFFRPQDQRWGGRGWKKVKTVQMAVLTHRERLNFDSAQNFNWQRAAYEYWICSSFPKMKVVTHSRRSALSPSKARTGMQRIWL